MYWVDDDDDDDPCECCGSPHHSWHTCPVARQRMEEDRERQDRIIFGLEKPKVSYIPFLHSQPHYSNSQGYYQVNNRYLGNSSSQRRPQYPHYQQQWTFSASTEQLLLEFMKATQEDIREIKAAQESYRKQNEARDTSHEELAKQVNQLAEEWAQRKHERDELARSIVVHADID